MEQSEAVDQDEQENILSQVEAKLSQYHSTSTSEISNSEIVSNPYRKAFPCALRRRRVFPFLRQYILLGFAAKGVVYFLIGILAIEAAILPEKKAAGTYTALKHLSRQPLGSALLCLLSVALLGYVIRRLLQAIIYPGHASNFSFKGILQRMGYIVSSLSYAGIAYSALSVVFKLGKYDDKIKHSVDKLFEQPIIGEVIVLIAGIAVTGVGIAYLQGAYTGSYISKFTSANMDHRLEYCARLMGKIGIAARGIAFIVTGGCLILASVASDSDFAGGLQHAFRLLAAQPLGWLWLGLIGSGFIAYGIYMLIAARYRFYTIR